MKIKIMAVLIVAGVIFVSVFNAMSASVVGSKHDLGAPYNSSEQVCVYCHTPHFANTGIAAPLWNRMTSSNNNFTLYSSPTMDSTPTQPTGPSLACLSCHDAVIGGHRGDVYNFHNVVNGPGAGSMPDMTTEPDCERCHGVMYGKPETWRLGRDLRKDHPISMVYPTATQDAGLFIPPDLQKGWPDAPLYRGKVECPSCHNVHDPSKTPFLRIANSGSALCYKCHNK